MSERNIALDWFYELEDNERDELYSEFSGHDLGVDENDIINFYRLKHKEIENREKKLKNLLDG